MFLNVEVEVGGVGCGKRSTIPTGDHENKTLGWCITVLPGPAGILSVVVHVTGIKDGKKRYEVRLMVN